MAGLTPNCKLLSNIAVANGVMLEPVIDGALEQLRPACDPRLVDPIEDTVLDINSPVADPNQRKHPALWPVPSSG